MSNMQSAVEQLTNFLEAEYGEDNVRHTSYREWKVSRKGDKDLFVRLEPNDIFYQRKAKTLNEVRLDGYKPVMAMPFDCNEAIVEGTRGYDVVGTFVKADMGLIHAECDDEPEFSFVLHPTH